MAAASAAPCIDRLVWYHRLASTPSPESPTSRVSRKAVDIATAPSELARKRRFIALFRSGLRLLLLLRNGLGVDRPAFERQMRLIDLVVDVPIDRRAHALPVRI